MLICKVALAAFAVVIATSAGCSFVFVDAPPPGHASLHYFDCTSSYLAPIVDVTLGGLLGLGTMGSMSDSNTESQAIVEGAIVAGAALASATYGFLHASHCRDAKLALAERLLEPPHLAPSPPPPFPLPRGAAPPPPVFRDPWRAEGAPPGGGNWGAGGNPAPLATPAPLVPPAPIAVPTDVYSRDAGGTDR